MERERELINSSIELIFVNKCNYATSHNYDKTDYQISAIYQITSSIIPAYVSIKKIHFSALNDE